jgi:hypothetical protein
MIAITSFPFRAATTVSVVLLAAGVAVAGRSAGRSERAGVSADASTGAPIGGATAAVGVCVPHQPFQGTSGPDGRYTVLLPGPYADICTSVTIEVRAPGYVTARLTVTVAELRAQPRRDFALVADTVPPSPTPSATPVTPTPTAAPPALFLPRLEK